MAQINNRNKGKGCPACSGRAVTDKNRLSILYPNISKEWNYKKNKNLNPENFCYGSNKKVWWKCSGCGHEWEQKISYRTISMGGCPNCSIPKGEKIIKEFLLDNNILFEHQKRFDDCRHQKPLPFDFYLPDYNICIEFQGSQHYLLPNSNWFGGLAGFNNRKHRDKIKKQYCKNNGINLVLIAYDKLNNINEILNKILL